MSQKNKGKMMTAMILSSIFTCVVSGCGQKIDSGVDTNQFTIMVSQEATTSTEENILTTESTLFSTTQETSSTTEVTTTKKMTSIHIVGNPNATVKPVTTPAPVVTAPPATSAITTTTSPEELLTTPPQDMTDIITTTTTILTYVAPNNNFDPGIDFEFQWKNDYGSLKASPYNIFDESATYIAGMIDSNISSPFGESPVQYQYVNEMNEPIFYVNTCDVDGTRTVFEITITKEGASTAKGIKIGSNISEIEAAYGTNPEYYSMDGEHIVYTYNMGNGYVNKLVFTISYDTVSRISYYTELQS
ncbi:MAG: hypothetical protein IJZ64_02790 [Ruminococcus sp.]|nr:hypothetical protein [Ruminococcus sp.]